MIGQLTPNVRRLLILRMSREAVPDGGGLADGLSFFIDAEKRKTIMANSEEWVRQAIALVRNASEPNPWRDASDDAIAGEILRRAERAEK